MRVQIQYEIAKQLLSSRYYTYILVSINFTDNIRKCHHVMVDGLRFRSGWLENMELLCAVSLRVWHYRTLVQKMQNYFIYTVTSGLFPSDNDRAIRDIY